MKDILDRLNTNQKEAVLRTEGPLLILAGAGSGKTRVITHRIANIIYEKKAKPWQIFAVTFTNKAAQEMRNRIIDLIGSAGSSVFAKTFHSAAVYILRRYGDGIGIPSSFTIYDTADQASVIKSILEDMRLDTKKIKPSAIAGNFSDIKDKAEYIQGAPIETFLPNKESIEIFKEYQSRMAANNALDFNDLLIKTVELFRRVPEALKALQRQWRYFMVDEYQDTNYAQYVIAKMLASETKNICVVGDDDQSIYSWRGADIRNILDFEKDYSNADVIVLEENYRSTEEIINAAAALIKNNEARKAKTVKAVNGSGELITYCQAANEYEEAEFVVNKIVSLKLKDGFANKDFAIFYRTNAQSRNFEIQLRQEGIPYKIIGGQKFYDRKEIKDIIAYMKVLANHADEVSLLRIINVPARGIGAATISKLRTDAAEKKISLWQIIFESDYISKGVDEFKHFMAEMAYIADNIPEGEKLSALAEQIIEKSGYRDSLDKKQEESRGENLDEFISSVYDYEQFNSDASLADFLQDISLLTSEDVPEENTDEQNKINTVTLMTVHNAKGLEFPVVFLTGLEENIFPHKFSSDTEEGVEEERRLCYVGITRAKEKLFLSNAELRRFYAEPNYNPPSRFIEELPEELLEHIEFAGGSARSILRGGFARRGVGSGAGTFGSVSSESLRAREIDMAAEPTGISKKEKSVAADILPSAGGNNENQQNKFKILDRVFHPKYGKGIILSIEGTGDNTKLDISFGPARKVFLEKYTPLEKL